MSAEQFRILAVAVAAMAVIVLALPDSAAAQGCVVARGAGLSAEHLGLQGMSEQESKISPLELSTSYRWLHSDRHFVGSEEQRERQREGSEVINSSHFMDIALTYSFNPRFSTTLTVPLVDHDRSQVVRANDPERTILRRFHTQASGLSDIKLTGNLWAIDPQRRPKGNVLISLGVDVPTGDDDVEDYFDVYDSTTRQIEKQRRTVDQSIQPGDGGWGLIVDLYAFRHLTERLAVYASGSYLVTPEEKNGVPTFRSNPYEAEMSIADTFMVRTGMRYALPSRFGLTLSLGARVEGVPVHDLVGGSDGFRRPGRAVSVEPGVTGQFGEWTASLYMPVTVYRNRERSIPDAQQTGATGVYRHGDAAFADYLLMFSVNKRFSSN